MARSNKFKESNIGIASLLDNSHNSDNMTTDIVNDLDTVVKNQNDEIGHAKADVFKPYYDEKLKLDLHEEEEKERLKESIEQNGIMVPVICDEDYMILSGHNRVNIALELDIEVPYIMKKGLSKEQKDLICIDTNLLNRQLSEYKVSQLAYILKVKMEAEKHPGRMLNGSTMLTGDKIGDNYKLTRNMVYRYIRLYDKLHTDVLELVDANAITFKTAYEFTYFTQEEQLKIIELRNQIKLSDKILKKLREEIAADKEKYNQDNLWFIKSKLMELCLTKSQVHKLDYRNIKKYIPKQISEAEVEDYVIKALKAYQDLED